MTGLIKILFIGDIIGKPGRMAVKELLPKVAGRFSPDVVIANGENSAGGFGLTPEVVEDLKSLQIDVITTGNHVWDKKEILDYIKKDARLLRPANYPPGAPGQGTIVFECPSGVKVGIVNLMGRVFMHSLDCPFRTADAIVAEMRKTTPVIAVDFHAEATSEKASLGYYLDGRVSGVIGTHTHVQTSDERILAGGTAFITDAGMTGPTDSVIGMRKDEIVQKFLTQMPVKFEVGSKDIELQGVAITVETATGRAVKIERIKEPLEKK